MKIIPPDDDEALADALDNLTVSCRGCNLSKKDKPLSEWLR